MIKSETMDKMHEVELFESSEAESLSHMSECEVAQKDLMHQFHYVKSVTKGFISMTWLILISYFIKNGVEWIEWGIIVLFLVVTYGT